MDINNLIKSIHHMGISVPSDMWNINEEYFSHSKGEFIPVKDMNIFHVIRSFCKQIRNDPIEKIINGENPDESIKDSLSVLKNKITEIEERI